MDTLKKVHVDTWMNESSKDETLLLQNLPSSHYQIVFPSAAFRVNNAYKRWDEARKNWVSCNPLYSTERCTDL